MNVLRVCGSVCWFFSRFVRSLYAWRLLAALSLALPSYFRPSLLMRVASVILLCRRVSLILPRRAVNRRAACSTTWQFCHDGFRRGDARGLLRLLARVWPHLVLAEAQVPAKAGSYWVVLADMVRELFSATPVAHAWLGSTQTMLRLSRLLISHCRFLVIYLLCCLSSSFIVP